MKTRKQVAEYINSGECIKEKDENFLGSWHFGKHEVRKILDFIYESKPSEDEKITSIDGG